jgi:hypothetical protein
MDDRYLLACAFGKDGKVIYEHHDVTNKIGGLRGLTTRIDDYDLRKEINALAASAGRDKSKKTTARATALAR